LVLLGFAVFKKSGELEGGIEVGVECVAKSAFWLWLWIWVGLQVWLGLAVWEGTRLKDLRAFATFERSRYTFLCITWYKVRNLGLHEPGMRNGQFDEIHPFNHKILSAGIRVWSSLW
jgi:hypothetical protein